MNTKVQKYSLVTLCIFGTIAFTQLFESKIANLIFDFYEKSLSAKGGIFNVYLLIISLPLLFVFAYKLLRQEYVVAFGWFLLSLPVLFRSRDFLFIPIYATPLYTHKLYLTTLVLFLLGFVIITFTKPNDGGNGKYLLAFGLLATLPQLISHGLITGILLSIVGIWQFIVLYFVISSIVKDYFDIERILNYLIYAVLVGIVFRVVIEGSWFWDFSIQTDRPGVGNFIFGWRGAYGCYLSCLIIVSLYFIIRRNKMFFIPVALIFLFEMFNTLTRGAVVQLVFVLVLLLNKQYRLKTILGFLVASIILIPVYGVIQGLVGYRGLELTPSFFANDPGVQSRFFLWSSGWTTIF